MRNNGFPLMLFAAGFGTRMGALTQDRPKPLIEVGGKALLDHALALADTAEITRKVVNLHYKGAQIAAHLAARSDVMLSWEEPEILDTGGGLRAALPLLGGADHPVMTLNTDAVWRGGNPLTQLTAHWDGAKMDTLLLLLPAHKALGSGGHSDFVLDDEGRLDWANGRAGYLYLGAQIIAPHLLMTPQEARFSLHGPWREALRNRRAFGVIYDGSWCDVGHPQGIAIAEEMRADV